MDNKTIAGLGVRAFNKAEEPKTGASLALPRRLARSVRRRLRRRAGRMRRAKELFIKYKLINKDELEKVFTTANGKSYDPWQLRAEGLDRLLSGEKFARALFHIAKRRGFKSNRKNADAKDKDLGKMKAGIEANTRILAEKGYRTAGEMIYKDRKIQGAKEKYN